MSKPQPPLPGGGQDYLPHIFHSLGEIKGEMRSFRDEQGVQNSRLDAHDNRIGALESARTSATSWLKGSASTISLAFAWLCAIAACGAWLYEKVPFK